MIFSCNYNNYDVSYEKPFTTDAKNHAGYLFNIFILSLSIKITIIVQLLPIFFQSLYDNQKAQIALFLLSIGLILDIVIIINAYYIYDINILLKFLIVSITMTCINFLGFILSLSSLSPIQD